MTTIQQTLEEMSILYSWTENTRRQYGYTINKYLTYYDFTFEEMISEAEEDEENITKINKRRIKTRLLNYQLHLKKEGLQNTSITNALTKIKQLYKYHDIEIPHISNLRAVHHESYKDIPTYEEIREAIYHSNTKMKAIITFLASTGLRRSDMVSLTVSDFFEATKEYHNCTSIPSLIETLSHRDDVIPLWEITSQKTNTSHITFNSPESTKFILQLLKERLYKEELTLDSSLFSIGLKGVTANFSRLNDKMGYGWNVTRRKFHAHSLRTYFSTTLTVSGLDYLSTEFLLGHKLDRVKQSYYYANPMKLRNKYARYVDKLTFTMNVEYVDISNREKEELEMLRRENQDTRDRLRQLEEFVDLINRNL